MAERFGWAWSCSAVYIFIFWSERLNPSFKLRFSLKYSPDIFRWSKNHWSVESRISLLFATDLMFLLWNMDKRMSLMWWDPFKSVVESYLPFATPSNAKDERHIFSQRVSSSRQDPPILGPPRVWAVPYSSIYSHHSSRWAARSPPPPPSNYTYLIAPISMVGKERVGGREIEAEDHLSACVIH